MSDGRTLHQIVTRTGLVARHASNTEPPVLELLLQPSERVVSVSWFCLTAISRTRKTHDWHWTAVIDHVLGA